MGLTKLDIRRIYKKDNNIDKMTNVHLADYVKHLENLLMTTDLVNKNGIFKLVSFSEAEICPICLAKDHLYSVKHDICLNHECPFYLGET